jgi:hypothetical protein
MTVSSLFVIIPKFNACGTLCPSADFYLVLSTNFKSVRYSASARLYKYFLYATTLLMDVKVAQLVWNQLKLESPY